jgi:hypothetical protein
MFGMMTEQASQPDIMSRHVTTFRPDMSKVSDYGNNGPPLAQDSPALQPQPQPTQAPAAAMAPSGAMPPAAASNPQVPMPMARPMMPQAAMVRPQVGAPVVDPMSFFQRNAAMMHDPVTGSFIDPQNASIAQAQLDQNGSQLIKRMFGYLNNKADNAPKQPVSSDDDE